jgi:hypothetical protein
MYKITLLFQSNEQGIYTKEEETADNTNWRDMKYYRMIDRWLNILCPHINKDIFITCINNIKLDKPLIVSEIYDLFLLIIKRHLDILNNIDNGNRKFGINVEEI